LFGIAAILFFVLYINRKYGSPRYIPDRILRLPPLIFLFGSYIFIYIAVLLIAKTFFEPNIGFEDRIITPILLSIFFLFTTLLFYLWNSRFSFVKVFVILVLIYVPVFSYAQAAATIRDYHQNGIGLARREMRTSKALETLRELANSKTVYNNNFYASYFYSGQVGYRLNHFSPVHDDKDQAVFAIYSSSAEDTFVHKYEDQLELITSDPVVSIYRFKPEP
jgi:Ca2+/Na+ antiporter